MISHRRRSRLSTSRKGQAATEYVHTYGWIILSVLMLGGVLFYHNISGLKQVVPMECRFLSGINCIGADVEDTMLSLVIINEFGFDISNVTMNITGTCNSTANTTDGNLYGNLNVLLRNVQAMYVFDCQNMSNKDVSERISMGYVSVDTGQEHIKVGKLEYAYDE